jgi:Ulp1 family protease
MDQAKQGTTVYTPFYLKNHWVVVCINKKKKELSYGECVRCSKLHGI